MKIGIIVLAAMFTSGCSLFQTQSPSVDPRALARGAVTALADAWNATSDLCLTAEYQNILSSGTCSKYLLPAHSALLTAASAVDAWQDADQKAFPCLIQDIFGGINNVEVLLNDVVKVQVPQLVNDALKLAEAFIPQCQRDGGV